LKRNRISWPEVAVNGQFLMGKSNFFVKLPERSRHFSEISLEKWIFLNCLKNGFFGNLPGKMEIFWTLIHDHPDFKPD